MRHPLNTILIVWLLTAGCGCRDRGPRPVPVAGVVTVDGMPLAGGSLMVAPEHARAAGGRIGPDGRFELSTWVPGDGVAPGIHGVEVMATRPLPGNRRQWLVPKDVRRLATTPLRLEVTGPTASAVIAIQTRGEQLEVESLGELDIDEGLISPED